MEILFPPGVVNRLIELIGLEKVKIYIQAYSFTHPWILKALQQAKLKGVTIRGIFDFQMSRGKGELSGELWKEAFDVVLDKQHHIAHNKILIFESQKIVTTGSYNFTVAAELHNAENLIILPGQEFVDKYLENWKNHYNHSLHFTP